MCTTYSLAETQRLTAGMGERGQFWKVYRWFPRGTSVLLEPEFFNHVPRNEVAGPGWVETTDPTGQRLADGAEIRYGGKVQWLDVDTRQPCPRKAPQVIAVLRPNANAHVPPGAERKEVT